MTRRGFIAFSPLVLVAQKRQSPQKPPEIELLEAAAHVEGNRVNIDGRVKNLSEKPLKKVIVIYEILDSDRNVLTKQQGPLDAAVLEPGAEIAFQSQISWHARAVSFRLFFEDSGGRDLRPEKTGPFPIE